MKAPSKATMYLLACLGAGWLFGCFVLTAVVPDALAISLAVVITLACVGGAIYYCGRLGRYVYRTLRRLRS